MTRKNLHEHKFTVRTHARSRLANALLMSKYVDRIANVGLLADDLTFIKDQGEAAKRYDAEQQSDLVVQRNSLTDTSKKWSAIVAEEDAVRMRLPAVADDLCGNPATRALGEWLANIGYETYRIRTSGSQPPEVATDAKAVATSWAAPSAQPAATPPRERVARTDRLAVALRISTFAGALLDPQRAPIVAAFETRSFARDRIAQLAADSKAVADDLGRAHLTSPEAGRLESEAAGAQKQRWELCRRMIRAAVAGDEELERLWAQC